MLANLVGASWLAAPCLVQERPQASQQANPMGRRPPWVPTLPSQRLVPEMRLNDDDATAPIHISLADEFPPAAERSCLIMDMASFGGTF